MIPLTRPLLRQVPPLKHENADHWAAGPHKRLKLLKPHGVLLGLYGDCTRIYGQAGIWGDCSCLAGDVSGLAGDVTNLFGDCSQVSGALDRQYGLLTRLRGDITRLSGDLSRLTGDATGLEGNCTGLAGDLDQIPMEWRSSVSAITQWVSRDDAPLLVPPKPVAVKPARGVSGLPLFAHLDDDSPAA
jgi:hypothetical protein